MTPADEHVSQLRSAVGRIIARARGNGAAMCLDPAGHGDLMAIADGAAEAEAIASFGSTEDDWDYA